MTYQQLEDQLRATLVAQAESAPMPSFPDAVARFERTIQRRHRQARLRWFAAVATAAALVLALVVVLPSVGRHRAEPTGHQYGLGTVTGSTFLLQDDTALFAVADGSLWTANPLGAWNVVLQKLDPVSMQQTGPNIPVVAGSYPVGIAGAGTEVWVATDDSQVRSFDTRTGRLVHDVRLAAQPGGLVVVNGSVWIASTSSSQVLRVDEATGHELAAVAVGPPPADALRPIVVAPSGLWVTNGDGSVSQIDPVAAREVHRYPVPQCCGDSIIADQDGMLWVTDESNGGVVRIDAAHGTVLARVPVDPSPASLAVYDGAVWVSCRGATTPAGGDSHAVVDRIDYRRATIVHQVVLPGGVESLVVIGGALVAADPSTNKLVIVRADR
jgi:streptogramin lyase